MKRVQWGFNTYKTFRTYALGIAFRGKNDARHLRGTFGIQVSFWRWEWSLFRSVRAVPESEKDAGLAYPSQGGD